MAKKSNSNLKKTSTFTVLIRHSFTLLKIIQ